ncbi:neural cell adhesion molecule 2-like isoform X1 [Dreissena polymorpha]|uniref:Ig-like domain-containing protein n=2 Tax=Dreissena polymorpha TaxID=45954 RepID=A0A9D4FEA1_DREPO|nr:neural cell adhesion molecule 2-like isoform X1 [Dreissena polymorpha]KAH3794222.1 hypothetical protein DPMN_147753 [Dreissena polymorpha]
MYYRAWILMTICSSVVTMASGVSPQKLPKRRGEPATLMCLYQGMEASTTIRWKSSKEGLLTNGMIVYKNTNNLEVQKPTQNDWNLIIKKVDDAFAGDYTCETSTGFVIARWTLEIVDGPKIIHESSSADHVTFPEESSPELLCKFSGVPIPTVRWFRVLTDVVDTGITGEKLRFPDVTRYASGSYTCVGTNKVSSFNYTIDLKVTFPVEVDVMKEEISARKGEVVSLVCVVQGQPIPKAYWTNPNGEKIINNWQFEVVEEGDGDNPVRFVTATSKPGALGFHDFGDYTCVGDGDSNTATKVTQLKLSSDPASGVIFYN